MAAPKNNQFWRMVKNPGRPKKYQPAGLWKIALEYFEHVDNNPMYAPTVHGKNSEIINVPKPIPYTLAGLCVYANISKQTYNEYESNKDFLDVTTRINEILYSQKFAGAAAGLFNANIIARDLGLADKKETKHSGSIGIDKWLE